ncbi:MAG TPA: anhydro-N-acetylmuramic acid kinase [Gemmatimonadaceae bacterium]|nr:anhydro-N-acetylmuramic acid kinase [Gemmatimonadaceae bacterium]
MTVAPSHRAATDPLPGKPAHGSGAVVVGLMSGTSLDGICAVVVRFTESDGKIAQQLLAFVSRPYSAGQRQRLSMAMAGVAPQDYTALDFELGAWLADAAVTAMAEAGVARSDIAAIASHGHTVWHDPPHATWQFGQAAVIAERTGLSVISDFRVRDVAAGGQGAPLVPIADALLFSAHDHWRALQNVGGMGNVTVVPPAAGPRLDGVRAFDTGPGVRVIDGVVNALYPALTMDKDGALARRGQPITAVVDHLLKLPFFDAPPPKSTGRELFTPAFLAHFIEHCRKEVHGCSNEDIVATAVRLTARSIALAFARFIPEPVAEVVLSGGGAKNPALFDAIERELSDVTASGSFQARRVVRFDDLYFDGEAKEAVAFALLGWLHLNGRPGNVPSATGARGPRVLGTFTPA